MVTIEANVAPGLPRQRPGSRPSTRRWSGRTCPQGIEYSFAGEAEDQAEATQFLFGAFISAIFLMFLILVTQFNSFYLSFVVMSAIVFSAAGVLLGLLVTGRPFGVVMGGIGMIALAGIVVNKTTSS